MRKGLLTLMLVAVLSCVVAASATLDVYFINVGHGDAILVKYGTQEWLIDTGYKNAWPNVGSCADLFGLSIDLPLEYFILSHSDRDHYSALDLFFCPCEISIALSSLDPESAELIGEDLESCGCLSSEAAKNSLRSLTSDSPIAFEDSGLNWLVLHPNSDFATGPENDNNKSLVLLLTFGSVSFLFTGDIEHIPEDADEWGIPPGVLILKAPHHGRENSATLALAEWLAPDIVVVSTGDYIAETAAAITQLGIPMLSTSTSGTIHVSTDGETVWVTTSALSRQIASVDEE